VCAHCFFFFSCCCDIATRQQFPLKLAWALTVHAVQGDGVEPLVVDCRRFFAAGQLFVAVSQVENFDRNLLFAHPDALAEDDRLLARSIDLLGIDGVLFCQHQRSLDSFTFGCICSANVSRASSQHALTLSVCTVQVCGT
jgi:hypothetical protein